MKKLKKLIIACDGESASGKSTAAKLISKKYRLLLINSGLLYRYASKLIINHRPKNEISFIKKKFSKLSYKNISKQNLHSEKISDHVAGLAKNKKVREIVNKLQISIIKSNNRICVEGRGPVSWGCPPFAKSGPARRPRFRPCLAASPRHSLPD